MLVSEKVFQKLSEKERAALIESGREATAWQRAASAKDQTDIIARLEKSGVKIVKVDTAPLQKAVAPVYQDYAKTIGGMALIDAVIKM